MRARIAVGDVKVAAILPLPPTTGSVRTLRLVTTFLLAQAVAHVTPLVAQRTRPAPDSATRAAIDEFVVIMRDMAAARIVTPAAHIPVGGLLDSAGHVASIVGSPPEPTFTPDNLLAGFRLSVGAGGRRQRSRAVALGYLARRMPPLAIRPVEAVVVEVEHVSGYRIDVYFPYTTNEFGEPVFGRSYNTPGTLRALDARRPRADH